MTRICVVGLGYIGLPTAAMFASAGHTVVGCDRDPKVLARLQGEGFSSPEPGLAAIVADAIRSKRLGFSLKPVPSDVFVVCVPTPLNHANHRADLSYVRAAMRSLIPHLRRGQMVVLESTVTPGTTAGLVAKMIRKAGLDPLNDVDVVHCPETVLPGNILKELAENERLVGGLTPRAASRAAELYRSFVRGPVQETDATTAELVKVAQNAYRDVNVAFANDLALLAREWGVDARNAIRLANRHPRVRVLSPGPGVGGHCIPIDPWFLVEGRTSGTMVRAARAVNDAMPDHVVSILAGMLRGRRKPRIAILGLAYKGNVEDARESPSMEIYKRARKRIRGSDVVAHDPHVLRADVPLLTLDEALSGADCIVIATDHREFSSLDPALIGSRMRTRLVLDARGVIATEKWKAAGFQIETL